MIIDTESPEGKALVALAKFGKYVMTEVLWDEDWEAQDVLECAEMLGLYADQIVDLDGNSELRETDLAKLPEGL